MSKGTGQTATKRGEIANGPQKGDHFRCENCGMELEITTACQCNDPEHVELRCCGQEMTKA